MDVFELRDRVVGDYDQYVGSFVTIRDERIRLGVDEEMRGGLLWPEPLVQLNPAFEPGESLDELVGEDLLHPLCRDIFCAKPTPAENRGPLRLHRHQVEALRVARTGASYVLTTGTGSGKSLAYIVPIVDHVLRTGSGRGIQAIVVYPMNALANSQMIELSKFLKHGFGDRPPVTFRQYTGPVPSSERDEIIASPPDILLTNYVMLELLLTRTNERRLVEQARGLRYLVLDELHTYRGRQGADVAMLVRRVRSACGAPDLIHVGTSATLSGAATWREQQEEVARVAGSIFGTTVMPDHVIGETLRRVTKPLAQPGPDRTQALRARVLEGSTPDTLEAFRDDPLAQWIESTLGLKRERDTNRLVRCPPRPLSGPRSAAEALAEETGLEPDECERAIRDALMKGYRVLDEQGRPLFAFRLHQFISKGDCVYATLESEAERHVTLQGQQFAPGSERRKRLFPVAFCRECGQEYYVVRQVHGPGGDIHYEPRNLSDQQDEDHTESGYLFLDLDPESGWPEPGPRLWDRLPESWVEYRDGDSPSVIRARTDRIPRPVWVHADGTEGQGGHRVHYVRAPFLFCMRCRVEYDAHQRSDYGKLALLGTEGRSSATTILSLSAIRRLRRDESLTRQARKLLSFTDNRQDASLQAGHFNDFVEIVLMRSGLYGAVAHSEADGLRHDTIVQRVFEALALPLEHYSINPQVKYAAREETDRALRRVLAYYLYRDLRRGWRITSPNLEQCGLLSIDYVSLADLCKDEGEWAALHPALAGARHEHRQQVCRVLLDHLRRELAIRVDVLDPAEQDVIRTLSNQHLIPPWAIDENEILERSKTAFARGRQPEDRAADRGLFVSARGGFGMFLRRPTTFPDAGGRLNREDTERIIPELFQVLCQPGGLLVEVLKPRKEGQTPGYQLAASAMVWRPGDGEQAFHDPVRVPNAPAEGLRTNPFFVEFYRSDLADLRRLEAREHTAQVYAQVREEREGRFRDAELPILYCSPTMELGVDISQLNVVNLRNVPPTPANYAQRSGRAGRSGQPALVYTYCSAGSPHDQYFFSRPELMVGGSVSTPRLDLGNADLLRAHVHAIWLSASNLDLHSSLSEILDVDGEAPSLRPRPGIQSALLDAKARNTAAHAATMSLGPAIHAMLDGRGTVEEWVRRVLDELPASFDRACERWRSLYRSAHATSRRQGAIVLDASRAAKEHERAKRLRAEAEAQLKLLLAAETSEYQSDFYSYRYFASEGFLPGYNFPRLPISAWLPGRRRAVGRDEYLQRPRFLAISEFGPRGIVYHEGSRFEIRKVMLPVEDEDATITRSAKQCDVCGYLHPIDDTHDPDVCERCGTRLSQAMPNLFPMRNVTARRRDRINSDEEERMRLGYELRTGVRFAEREGAPSVRTARLLDAHGKELAHLEYGHAATLWRINVGWRRRSERAPMGYVLDAETGVWSSIKGAEQGSNSKETPEPRRKHRVIPYVEDRRNCLLVRLGKDHGAEEMASMQAALKAAIQTCYQLEDSELAAEPLPNEIDRREILLYEASEGGAGVLRRLVEDSLALPAVARAALERCHFDPDTGADRRKAPGAREDCEAGCYDCLLSYYNQRDHRRLDRQLVKPLLEAWAAGRVETSPRPLGRDEHLARLMRLCHSELERRWLRYLDRGGYNLPSDAQRRFDGLSIQADFYYADSGVVVFVDGPHHDTEEQQAKDTDQTRQLLTAGFPLALRFHHAADWSELVQAYPSVFGPGREES